MYFTWEEAAFSAYSPVSPRPSLFICDTPSTANILSVLMKSPVPSALMVHFVLEFEWEQALSLLSGFAWVCNCKNRKYYISLVSKVFVGADYCQLLNSVERERCLMYMCFLLGMWHPSPQSAQSVQSPASLLVPHHALPFLPIACA